jgi:predicted negative regulator of RcsB-dependent stress response
MRNKKYLRFVYLTFLLFASSLLNASYDIWFTEIKSDIYSCNLQLAKNKLDAIKSEEKNNPYYNRILNHYDFLQILLFENSEQIDAWANELDQRISIIEKNNYDPANRAFLMSEAYLHSTIANLFSGNEIKAVSSFKKGFSAYENLEKLSRNSAETLVMRGIYNFFLGSMPEQYEWLVSLLGMEGDFELGIISLKESLLKSSSLGDTYERAFYYALFASFTDDNSDLLYDNFLKITEKYHKNPIMRYAISVLAENTGNTKSCLNYLLNNQVYQGDTYLNLLDYQIGIFLLFQLDKRAINYFEKYIVAVPKSNNLLNAQRSLYWYYIINNRKPEAELVRKNAIKTAQNLENEQGKYIITELSETNKPNIHLLKARLLYNGSNYTQALSEINHFSTNNTDIKHLSEFYYRKAKILEKLNKQEDALSFYKKCIVIGKEEELYFAAQSAINTGIIYSEFGDKQSAKTYYQLSIKIKQSAYKSSMNREAKRRIKSLNQ